MFQFILTNLLLLSLGTIVFLMIRTLPRIDESESPQKKNILERWLTSQMPEKLDKISYNFLSKLLRKSKVSLLKVNNVIDQKINQLKIKNPSKEESKKLKGLQDIAEEKVREKEEDSEVAT